MPRTHRAFLGLALAGLAACGGGDGGGGTTDPGGTQTLGSIVPSATALTLTAGQSQALTVTARDQNGATMPASGYTYTSSAPSVAQVSTSGRVVGLSAGPATVTVSLTVGSVTRTATVAVTVSGALPNTATVAAGAVTNDFTPDLVAVARNGSVTWTFGATAHTVEFSSAGAPGFIPSSQNTSVSRTFGNAGNFNYTCTLHSGQNGAVIVP